MNNFTLVVKKKKKKQKKKKEEEEERKKKKKPYLSWFTEVWESIQPDCDWTTDSHNDHVDNNQDIREACDKSGIARNVGGTRELLLDKRLAELLHVTWLQ